MDIQHYLDKMKNIEQNIINFIDNENSTDDDFTQLSTFLQAQNVINDPNYLKEILHLIVSIADYHHYYINFFNKLDQILLLFTKSIQQYLNQHEIFNIFISNKRLLLFLFEHKLIVPDKYIINMFFHFPYIHHHYPEFFYPEVKDMYEEVISREDLIPTGSDEFGMSPSEVEFGGRIPFSKSFDFFYKNFIEWYCQDVQYFVKHHHFKLSTSDEFLSNRKSGKNLIKICEIIQNDSIVDFIKYVNKEEIDINGQITLLPFEIKQFTHILKITLIEYAALCGSIQILMHLYKNKVDIYPDYIWIYAIHGRNAEIIYFLIDNKIEPRSYVKCYLEAVKCRHFEIADFIKGEFLTNGQETIDEDKLNKFIVENYNYSMFTEDLCKKTELFGTFCQSDYLMIWRNLLENYNCDINTRFSEKVYDINDEKTALLDAIIKEKNNFLNSLLSNQNVDVNAERIHAMTIHGRGVLSITESSTPLIIAVQEENIELIKHLLKLPKIDVNCHFKYVTKWCSDEKFLIDQTPLVIAIDNQNTEIVRLLLQQEKIDPNSKMIVVDQDYQPFNKLGSVQMTPLNLAILKGNIEIIQLLLNSQNIDLFDDKPLYKAAFQQENIEILKLLLSNERIRSNKDLFIQNVTEILIDKFKSWDPEIIKLLLSIKEINFNVKVDEPIEYERRPVKVADHDMNDNFESLLHIAIKKENIEIIKLLINEDMKIDINCLSLIQKVMNPVYLKKPLRQVIKIKTQKKSPLCLAVEKENEEIVKILMSRNDVDVNTNAFFVHEEILYHSLLGDDGGGWIKDDVSMKEEIKTVFEIAKEKGNQKIIHLLEKH